MENLAKRLKKLLGEQLISVYSYEQSVGVFVPIIVVKTMNFVVMSKMKKDFEGKMFIVLTEDDIQRGQDVFALKYLHMMKHADLLLGEDVLLTLTIDKQNLRDNLEFELRSKLIQLRESYLSFGEGEDFLPSVLLVMEPIWEGVLVLGDDPAVTEEDFEGEELLGSVAQLCSCKIDVFQYLYGEKPIDKNSIPEIIEAVNEHMIELRNFVEGK